MIYAISSLITAIMSIALGSFVMFKGRRNRQNQLWFLTSFSIFLWTLGLFWCFMAQEATNALLWQKVLYLGTTLIPIFFFHYCLLLAKADVKYRKYLIVGYVVAFIFIVLIPTNLIIEKVIEKNSIGYWPVKVTNLYYLYLLYFALYMVLSIAILAKGIKENTGSKKQQILFVLYAALIGYIGGSFNFLLDFNFNYPIGNLFVSFYVIVVSYAIVRHRLMNIQVVLRASIVFILSLLSIIIPSVILKYIVNIYFARTEVWIDFLILIGAIALFPSLKNYYYYIANKYFFSSLYDAQEVIAQLSDSLSATIDAKKIFKYITSTFIDLIRVKSVGILTLKEKDGKYYVRYKKEMKINSQMSFDIGRSLDKHYIAENRAIVIEELKHEAYVKYKQIIDRLERLGVEIIIPLKVKDKTIGIIFLGEKESGDMYNDEDLQVFEIIGTQSAIALENALLFEETKNFSIKLEKEVEKATSDLRKANEQLKILDQAKSDFVSIASHQLRTPLTVIKGYISMILEGNFGKVVKIQRDSLEKVYDSNERLILLVENLLNISRIESGRLRYNFVNMHLEKLVADVVRELTDNAEKKGLKLVYQAPKEKLPEIRMDEEKIRQVVMNFVDNAIKYTPQGSIYVSIKKIKNNIRCSVKDNGIGVRKEDQANLFKKFSRGQGTFLVNTEGTGLGLYVAKQMIDSHKGKLWVESEGVNKGSTFCFQLPIAK